MWTDDRVFSGRALNDYVDGFIFPAGLLHYPTFSEVREKTVRRTWTCNGTS